MKKTTITVLLSALAFPGAGHLFLKHTIRGIILMVLFGVLLYPITSYAYQQAQLLAKDIISGHVAPTLNAIQNYLAQHSNALEQLQQLTLFSYAILLLWLIGILDSYRLAKIQTIDQLPAK